MFHKPNVLNRPWADPSSEHKLSFPGYQFHGETSTSPDVPEGFQSGRQPMSV